ncbi:hypothetical protein GCM10023188_27040 [Pontibacter saemangeumensis]|uniref:Aerotolerance regulator N-terminal domain-containing protein n=1 Tax=Pontibacter saemangeumensis TaxID=1084525 RepID=A0ABP8LSP5_9BACT
MPIAIHLWNKRQGTTVKMGSLRWLEASASRRWSRVKLNEVWLLLLRCFVLLLLAAALAQPVLVRPPQKPDAQKAVYIGQELLYTSTARQQIQPTIAALLQRGYRLYSYAPGFAAIPQEQWQQISSSTQDSVIYSPANYWGLLPALAEKHKQPQDSIWLFTSDQQRYFAGARPVAVPANIRWLPVASGAAALWLQAAVQTAPDSLLLLIGEGSREGITYSRQFIGTATKEITLHGQTLELQWLRDTLQATFPGNSSSNVRVQTEPLYIALLADEAQQPELRYLQAALSAISRYTRFPIQITTEQDTAADWVFWLKDGEVPPQLQQQVAQNGLNLWVQPTAKPTAINTYMATAGEDVPVHQLRGAAGNEDQHILWATRNGGALLTVQPSGSGHIYRFRSGFSPALSGLGQSAQLPELLLPLLFPQPEAGGQDVRALDEQQLKPALQPVTATAEAPEARRISLVPWLVSAAFILFLTERILARRRATI